MSQYPQFNDQHLEMYQLLPRPYLGSFEGDNGEKMTKEKWVLDWTCEAEKLSVTVLKEKKQINIVNVETMTCIR